MGVGRWMTPKMWVFSEGVGISWYLCSICDKCCHADRANWRIGLISRSKPYLDNVKQRIHEKTLLAAFSFPEQSGVSMLDPSAVTLGRFWNIYSLLPFNSVYLTEEEIGRKDIGFLTFNSKNMEWFDGGGTAATIPLAVCWSCRPCGPWKQRWSAIGFQGNQDWSLQCPVWGWAPREVLQSHIIREGASHWFCLGFFSVYLR